MGDEPERVDEDAQFGLNKNFTVGSPSGDAMDLEVPQIPEVIEAVQECEDCDYQEPEEGTTTLCNDHAVDLLLANEGMRAAQLAQL